jgi:hypothetical protein
MGDLLYFVENLRVFLRSPTHSLISNIRRIQLHSGPLDVAGKGRSPFENIVDPYIASYVHYQMGTE